MMLFWTITVAMILAALALLAPSLLRNRQSDSLDRDRQNVVIARERLAELETERSQGILDQAQFEKSKGELELSLLQDLDQKHDESVHSGSAASGRLALGIVAVFVPALTLGLYSYLGTPSLVGPRNPALTATHETGKELPSVEQMMGALTDRLKQNPDDTEGWYLLGRTNMALKDYVGAAAAFEKVHQLVGEEPSVLLAWADAVAMKENGNMRGKPTELIRRAVKLAPDNTTALWLAGMVEEQADNYELAISYWERLAPQVQDDSQASARIATLISKARERLGATAQPAVVAPQSAGSGEKSAATGKGVSVRVSMSPELSGKVGPDEALFIYARALQGPKMPLAAARKKVRDLPITLLLDDVGAMMPAMKISNFEQVVVGARVSRSGGAIARSGDLKGEVSPVDVGMDAVIEIVIDTIVP